MNRTESNKAAWSDVHFVDGDERMLSYRTGMAVYDESLTRGSFVGRGWNAAGYTNFYDGRVNPSQQVVPQAFWLEIDGQMLIADWDWAGLEKTETAPGCIHASVTLRHKVRPVTVRVHTKLDGTAILTRWLEITNTADRPAAMAAAFSWSGVLQQTTQVQSHLGQTGLPLYSIGYFDCPQWGVEGDFKWFDLPTAGYRIDGRFRRDRFRHPMFVLRNNATGEHFIGQLAWSGSYSFEFDHYIDVAQTGYVWFRAGIDAPAPQRMIDAGETISLPEMHLGTTFGDLDTAIQSMHEHVRKSVMRPQPRGRGGWVESGIGPEIEITPEEVIHAIDAAADFGAEVFFIDASWYGAPKADWWATVGDWTVSLERFPKGFKPFRDRIREKGMLWGLWMEAERIGKNSRVYNEHPEWVATAYDGVRIDTLLDISQPAAAAWMEQQITRVIEEYELEFFRLDYNIGPITGVFNRRDGFIENGYMRYYEALYAIYDRIGAKFPNLVMETCSSGGARTDLGMVRRFSHTWVTDWQRAPRSFLITNGMTMALPPEYVDRLIGGQSGHTRAEFDFQMRLLLFVRPTIGFMKQMGAAWNPHLLERLRHGVELYKEFIRPMMNTGRIYHHTPTISTTLDPQGIGVLELASDDRLRGMCGLFQLSAPTQPEYVLRLRGLDESRRYRVTFDNSGRTAEIDGYVLMKQGLTIRLEGALTSELLLFQAI